MNLILFILGLVVLISGADLLIDGATSLAKKLGVSNIVIGLTVVSIGTSLPELVVNINSSITNSDGIAFGNIIGSNIANILLILGLTSLFYPLLVKKATAFIEIPYSFFITLLVFILIFSMHDYHGLNRIEGIILIILHIVFIFYAFRFGAKHDENEDEDSESHIIEIITKFIEFTNVRPLYRRFNFVFRQNSWGVSLFFVISGLLLLLFGGKLTVDKAAAFALDLGVSEEMVALTILAFGTSLPELITCLVAAAKKNVDIAVGNIVGSNIFNILWVLGLTSVISPISISGLSHLKTDFYILMVTTVLFFVFSISIKKYIISRLEGLLFFLGYIAYLAFLIIRG